MRPGRAALLVLLAPALFLLCVACDSGTPSGGPVQSGTVTPTALASLYNVPATMTALSNAFPGSETPVLFDDIPPADGRDACSYLRREDVNSIMGIALEQNPRGPTDNQASCTYSGDANYVTLALYKPVTPGQAAQVNSQNLEFLDRAPEQGEFVPAVGDAAALIRIFPPQTSVNPQDPLEQQIGWSMRVLRGDLYLTLTWYTDRVAEKDKLLDLTRKVLSRL